ncbi:MAG: hypothetical protein FJY73_13480 [Candidatus Eisenbacteria bacterium]|nr:hypothetical protein [Candidatus Eisenbacteria bacterium]
MRPRLISSSFRGRFPLRAGECALLVILLFAAAGCGASGLEKRRKGYEAFYRGDLDGALTTLERKARSKDRLLAALDRGVILHTAGRTEESNEAFARAEEILEEVDVLDLSDQATAFLINDYQLEYQGEDFEKVLVHPFKALNYLAQDDRSAALVECRALNNRLVEIQEKYEKKNVYAEDAFARYLSGIIYESEGNRNDALVAYRLAVAAFDKHGEAYGTPFPASLRSAVLRLAEAQGLGPLVAEFRERWPDAEWTPYAERRKSAEIVLVLENGQAPVKEEKRFDVVAGEEIFSLAFPSYRAIPPRAAYCVLRAGGVSARTELAGDIAAIAEKDLEDRYGRAVARMIARLVVKHVEVDRVKKKNRILGAVLNIANTLNERADLRSWETLPSNFQIARLSVPPGTYEKVEIDLFSHQGNRLETIDLGPWEMEPGRTRFLYHRTME